VANQTETHITVSLWSMEYGYSVQAKGSTWMPSSQFMTLKCSSQDIEGAIKLAKKWFDAAMAINDSMPIAVSVEDTDIRTNTTIKAHKFFVPTFPIYQK
jgi:hypothetical protein